MSRMHRVGFLLAFVGLLTISSPAFAASILPSAKNTIAPAGHSWGTAGAQTGDHFHNGILNAGENGVEEERGLVEFNLTTQSLAGSALLTFENVPFQSCCNGLTGGIYTIGVYSYQGDNSITLGDYSASGSLVGTFSTAGMTPGTAFSFDVTSAFNKYAGGSLGIRLQALSEPGSTSHSFGDFEINTTAAAVPEPMSLLLVGTGLAGAGLRRYRSRRS